MLLKIQRFCLCDRQGGYALILTTPKGIETEQSVAIHDSCLSNTFDCFTSFRLQ